MADACDCEYDEKARIGDKIKSALENYGFFRITGHGIDTNNILNVSKEFYDLPIEEKQKIGLKNWRGWSHLGSEVTKGKKDWHECLDMLAEVDSGSFSGQNQWPESIDGFQEIVTSYINNCRKLGRLIMECIIMSYGLPSDSDIAQSFQDGFYIFRLLHYPQFPDNLDQDESVGMGIGPHTDYGCLTFVVSDQEGLEVKVGDEWQTVELIDDHIVCNIGDMLSYWSGSMKATEHRVRRVQNARHSAAFFFEPDLDTMITPLKNDMFKNNMQIHYGYYLESKYVSSYPSVQTDNQ
jgi:isopenicillin N synthase-like dioxygenase